MSENYIIASDRNRDTRDECLSRLSYGKYSLQDAWVTRRFTIHEAGNCRRIKSEISACLSLPAASFILNIYISPGNEIPARRTLH